MKYITDLHLHSKYSRAVSPQMVLPVMSQWAKKKGIDILTTGDWTHPLWFRHIQETLEEKEQGLYQVKNEKLKVKNLEKEVRFLLSVEISSIYSQGGKTRRIHNLIFAPNLETAEKINKEMLKRGYNLSSDGRPIIGLSAENLLEMVLSIDNTAFLVPCHAWTPWFSLYGSMSGFDSIGECFGKYAKYIFAVETGLSSDPEMNWRIKELENRSILSFSDSHSPAKMGRETTVFELEKLSFVNIRRAILAPYFAEKNNKKWDRMPDRVAYTIEFYPEEGKYHYTGHRNCGISQAPEETIKRGVICPVCEKPLTVGVMHRVQELSEREISNIKYQISNDENGVQWVQDPTGKHAPYVKLVPLNEIIAESLSSTVASQKVKDMFDELCLKLGSEIQILLNTSFEDIANAAGVKVAEGVKKVRKGDIVIKPGFDGEYGVVKIWNEGEQKKLDKKATDQLGIDF